MLTLWQGLEAGRCHHSVRGKREVPERSRRPAASSGTILTSEYLGVARPGIEPGSPWCEASSLTTQPPCRFLELYWSSHVVTDWSHVVTDWSHVVTDWSHVITDWSHVVTHWSHVVTDWSHVVTDWYHVVTDWYHVVTDWSSHVVTGRAAVKVAVETSVYRRNEARLRDEQFDIGLLWSRGSGNSRKSLDKCALRHVQRAAVSPALIELLLSTPTDKRNGSCGEDQQTRRCNRLPAAGIDLSKPVGCRWWGGRGVGRSATTLHLSTNCSPRQSAKRAGHLPERCSHLCVPPPRFSSQALAPGNHAEMAARLVYFRVTKPGLRVGEHYLVPGRTAEKGSTEDDRMSPLHSCVLRAMCDGSPSSPCDSHTRLSGKGEGGTDTNTAACRFTRHVTLSYSSRISIPPLLHPQLIHPRSVAARGPVIPKKAAVVQQLDCLPPTKANRVQSPARLLVYFRMCELWWTMPLLGGFSRGSPITPALHIFR
ncbi:hypothetical protein PR048_019096 [Dryococelus australis]|uniref:Uncharacterized protein n=1 Tax=Dryococelus australis TaxID=614101 RepID=A0ABQ9H2I8_9NEOP|nr:hypothetical protein PR048_019096 [Dryococelus australis]